MKKVLILTLALMLILSVASVGMAAKSVRVMVEVTELNEAVVKELKGKALNVNFESLRSRLLL